MEAETYFLFLFWTEQPKPYRVEGNTEQRGFDVTMRRTSMQRPIRPGDKFKRVPIEFDPLGKDLVYAVTCFAKSEVPGCVSTDLVRPAYIVETEDEAKKLKTQLEAGGHKEFLERKEKLERIEIHPLVVTVV